MEAGLRLVERVEGVLFGVVLSVDLECLRERLELLLHQAELIQAGCLHVCAVALQCFELHLLQVALGLALCCGLQVAFLRCKSNCLRDVNTRQDQAMSNWS